MDVERRGTKRRNSAGGTAFTKKSKALPKATENQIKKIVDARGEMKYLSTSLASTAITANTSPTVVSPVNGILPIATGATANDRIGNAIYLHAVRIKMRLRIPKQALTAGGCNPAVIRVAIVRDMDPVPGSATTGADIFVTASTADESINVFQNVSNIGRFQVLKDKTMVLQDPNLITTGVNGRATNFKLNHKFRNPLKIKYQTTGSAPITDSLHVVVWVDSVDLAPTVAYISRCSFKDV